MRSLSHQRGIVVLWAVIFLIVGVMITLTQVYDIAGSRGVATAQQSDSTAAFFLAESGLARGTGVLNGSGSPFVDTSCTGVATTKTLGQGSFTLTGVPNPLTCDTGGATPCLTCTLTSKGVVGSATRTIVRTINIESKDGASCNGAEKNCTNQIDPKDKKAPFDALSPTSWSLLLRNPYPDPALAVFHLASTGLSSNSFAACTVSSNCSPVWSMESSAGLNMMLSMGNVEAVAANSLTLESYQIVPATGANIPNIAAVGIFVPAPSGGAVPIRGEAYWAKGKGMSPGTTGKKNQDWGETNNGAATNPTPACTTPQTDDAQICTDWCYGKDVLFFGLAAGSASALTDTISSVTFNNDNGQPTDKNIGMTLFVHFPSAIDNLTNPPTDVFSEFWYKRNPWFIYGGHANGTVAINQTAATSITATTDGTTSLAVTAASASLYPGDTITFTFPGPITYVRQIMSGTPGTSGTFMLDQTIIAGSPSASATRTILTITDSTLNGGSFLVGQALTDKPDNASIPSNTIIMAVGPTGGGTSQYYLSKAPPANITALRPFTSGAYSSPGNATIHTPGLTPPANTIVAVRYGQGEFAYPATNATTPSTTASGSFTVTTAPVTALDGAQICGGTCAFFDHRPGVTKTKFHVTQSAASDAYWAGGFLCVSGAGPDFSKVRSLKMVPQSWREPVN